MRQVPGHPVGRADEERALHGILVAGRKVKDARVLQEPADDGSNANRLAEPGDARPQTAEAAHDQIDGHPGARCLAERHDDLRILELVHLGDNARGPAGPLMLDLLRDETQKPLSHGRRRDQQLRDQRRLGPSGQMVEELNDVRRIGGIARQQADVGVQPRRLDMIVTGADVGIRAQARTLAPDDRCDFRKFGESGLHRATVNVNEPEAKRPTHLGRAICSPCLSRVRNSGVVAGRAVSRYLPALTRSHHI